MSTLATTNSEDVRRRMLLAKKGRPPLGLEPDNITSPGMSNLPPDPDGVPRGEIRTPSVNVPAAPSGPMTRTVGSNSVAKNRESDALLRDRNALVGQLQLKTKMINAATGVGDHATAARLQSEFDALKGQRADIENTGRDLAMSKEHTYVTPAGAQASHDRLAADLASPERQAEIRARTVMAARPREAFSYEQPRPMSSDPRTAALQVDAQNFNDQAPINNPGSDTYTTRQKIMANQRAATLNSDQQVGAAYDANPATMGPAADAAGIDRRWEQTQTDVGGADGKGGYEKSARDAIAKRQATKDFQTKMGAGERDLASANLDADVATAKARGTNAGVEGQTKNAIAQGQLLQAKRATEGVAGQANDRIGGNILETMTSHIDSLGFGRSLADRKIFDNNLSQLEANWPKMSPDQKTEFSFKLNQMADDIENRIAVKTDNPLTNLGRGFTALSHLRHPKDEEEYGQATAHAQRLRALASTP